MTLILVYCAELYTIGRLWEHSIMRIALLKLWLLAGLLMAMATVSRKVTAQEVNQLYKWNDSYFIKIEKLKKNISDQFAFNISCATEISKSRCYDILERVNYILNKNFSKVQTDRKLSISYHIIIGNSSKDRVLSANHLFLDINKINDNEIFKFFSNFFYNLELVIEIEMNKKWIKSFCGWEVKLDEMLPLIDKQEITLTLIEFLEDDSFSFLFDLNLKNLKIESQEGFEYYKPETKTLSLSHYKHFADGVDGWANFFKSLRSESDL
jgi:hypothetical protein